MALGELTALFVQQCTNFNNFYVLGEGFIDDIGELAGGNFTIESLNASGNIITNISFNLSFTINYIDGELEEINETPFAFIIPFSGNISKFVYKENITILDEVNVTPHTPNVTVLSPNGGDVFSNQLLNITWNASDADGDNLSYAVLISSNNGSSYSTLIYDYNKTSFLINSSLLADSKNYIVKVLATDGVNTGNDTSDGVFEIDNDLNVTSFRIVFTNQSLRVFEIKLNNTLTLNISNISWTLNTGEDIKSSQFSFNLKSAEQIFFYLTHNYSISGNFSVIFSAFNNQFLETEIFQLGIP